MAKRSDFVVLSRNASAVELFIGCSKAMNERSLFRPFAAMAAASSLPAPVQRHRPPGQPHARAPAPALLPAKVQHCTLARVTAFEAGNAPSDMVRTSPKTGQ